MPDRLTAEQQYRLLATEARTRAASETDPYTQRRLLLSAQHYELLAERAKRWRERRFGGARHRAVERIQQEL